MEQQWLAAARALLNAPWMPWVFVVTILVALAIIIGDDVRNYG